MTEIANENELPIVGLVQAVSTTSSSTAIFSMTHAILGWCFSATTIPSVSQSQPDVQGSRT